MMGKKNEPVEVEDVEVVDETEQALVCRLIGVDQEHETFLIPKSQVLDDSEVQDVGDVGILVVPQWLAEDRGLV